MKPINFHDKKGLLKHALALPNSPRQAILFADRNLSDEQISAHRDKALQDVKKLKIIDYLAQILLVLGAFYLAVSFALTINSNKFSNGNAHLFASVAVSFVVGCIVKMFYDMFLSIASSSYDCFTSERHLRALYPQRFASLLMPAADAEHCEIGVQALRSEGQNAKTWRDLALQERSQLYVFDVEIMRALAQAEASDRAKLAKILKKEEDCRTLHGLVS